MSHQMHEMMTIASDDPGVSQFVSRCFMRLRCAKTAERIEVLFEVETLGTQ